MTDLDKNTCKCSEVEWECWLKEYDSEHPDVSPSLWFSTKCASCGAATFTPLSDLDESTIPKHILERGLKGLKRIGEERS